VNPRARPVQVLGTGAAAGAEDLRSICTEAGDRVSDLGRI